MQMAEKMSYNPAKVIGSNRGSLEVGKDADIVIFNPKKHIRSIKIILHPKEEIHHLMDVP